MSSTRVDGPSSLTRLMTRGGARPSCVLFRERQRVACASFDRARAAPIPTPSSTAKPSSFASTSPSTAGPAAITFHLHGRHHTPVLSNALVAAFKCAQAHQRWVAGQGGQPHPPQPGSRSSSSSSPSSTTPMSATKGTCSSSVGATSRRGADGPRGPRLRSLQQHRRGLPPGRARGRVLRCHRLYASMCYL